MEKTALLFNLSILEKQIDTSTNEIGMIMKSTVRNKITEKIFNGKKKMQMHFLFSEVSIFSIPSLFRRLIEHDKTEYLMRLSLSNLSYKSNSNERTATMGQS